MFRIRRIYDDVLPVNRAAISQVQRILAQQFPALRPEEIEQIAEKLRNPFKQLFRSILYVAEDARYDVQGFALVMHEPELKFLFLDFIASAPEMTGRGIGGALYEHIRDEALALGAKGLFFECLPDDPEDCPDENLRAENAARLRFYEQYGARPIVGTAYRTPVRPGDTLMPHLVYDGLDRAEPLRPRYAQKVVRAILERKYSHLCPPEYVEKVVRSFTDDPIRLREPRYTAPQEVTPPRAVPSWRERVALVVNDRHSIHHVRERGYVEAPARVRVIAEELGRTGWFETVAPDEYPEEHVTAVHDADFVRFLRDACAAVPEGKSVYPYVFPIRNAARPPSDLGLRAGYYCIDT
ncbi:MAG TPA: GNAT family N-acetyltransferase, partial [Gemmataceae bacterium]